MRLLFIFFFILCSCRSPGKLTIESTSEGEISAEENDADGDGYNSSDDCDDANNAVNPASLEICDGIDNNCDGQIDEGVQISIYADADGDAFGDPNNSMLACEVLSGYSVTGTDCNDAAASVYPGHPEICDGLDNDCDGFVDGADAGLDPNSASSFYIDADGDGYGDPDTEIIACFGDAGAVDNGEDCEDGNSEIYPGAEELCDGLDNDCDSLIDAEDSSLLDPEACSCYSLDVDGGYAQVDSVSLIPVGNSPRSVSIWFKPHTNGTRNLISWGNGQVPNQRFSVHLKSTSGTIGLRFCGQNNDHFLTAIPLNTWSHVVMVFSGSQLNMYINGVLTDSVNTTLDTAANTPVMIGRNTFNRNDEYFDGQIATTRIWDRDLGAAEVEDLYYNGTVPASGLVADWLFSGEATLIDVTGNGHDAVIIGLPNGISSWVEDCPVE
ncbi:MAG: MopE-related protein [Myxococcota bacterium]|nr:MopE-related protein [Myxococcota bacterium]